MCAAPGMKTTYLAALMKNKGKVYAIERDVKRYKELCGTVDHADSRIVQPINEDAFNIDHERCPAEYILLDPSCSGSGMLNRDGKEQFDRERVYKLAGLQYKLLKHAMVAFPDVKRIVYSTCSRYTEENEDVVHGIVRTTPNFKLLNGVDLLDNKWISKGSELFGEIGTRCLYARTTDDMTCTFFVAVFERCAEGEVNEFYEAKRFSGAANNSNQQQPIENRNERRKKKWQQAKLENGGNENGADEPAPNDDNVLNEENQAPTESRNEKRKKKWLQAKMETGGTEQPATEDIVLNEENEILPKKKKSKKHSISQEEEEPPAEVPKKKSKKTKDQAEPCEEIPEEPVKKVKKSKKSREVTEEPVDEPEVVEKREKKSKKKSSEDHTEAEAVEAIEDVPKKEKKSKKKKLADVEETVVEVEPEVKPKKSKKAKK
jgi:25S rRNA (cytosine2278-C5)-methyltransferase